MGGSLLISNSCYKVAAKTHCTKMKVLALIALFASAASAFVVPLPAGVQAQVIKQCEGFQGIMNLISGDMPATINIPSKIPLNFVTELTDELPGDLVIFMKLKKLAPFPLDVPCFNGVGSCEYDGCSVLTGNPSICKVLHAVHPDIVCECPLVVPKGTYDFHGAEVEVPDMGATMDKLMAGHYTAKMTAYGKSNPSKILGCFDLEFTFTINK